MPARLARLLSPLLPLILLSIAAEAQARGTIVIAAAREAVSPVPLFWQNDRDNREVSDLMFLRLADMGPELNTADERSFVPRLARSWRRVDPKTLVFELDPRARWHDGRPVTARDVVFTLSLARDRRVDPQIATLVRHVVSATADGDRRVTMKFDQAYPEQLYDATYNWPILPEHLLGGIPPDSLSRAAFFSAPVGNGPFKWKGRVGGELLELTANDGFFLGRPGLDRVIFRVASDPEARFNLLLSGEADALDNIAQFANWRQRLKGIPVGLFTVPTFTLGYLVFNQRDPADTAHPHPILADRQVRRALTLALDRRRMVQSVFEEYSEVPAGPVSQLLWIHKLAGIPLPFDTAQARRLLAARGWSDHDGDGVVDKDGRPLSLVMTVPSTSAARRQIAQQAQEQWRQIGVSLELKVLEPPVIVARRSAGDFDVDFGSVTQDPTPSGLVQTWSCAGIGGSNVAKYCDPKVDTLLERASKTTPPSAANWAAVLKVIADDVPAAWVYAPAFVYAAHRRFDHVVIRPESSWLALWQWSVRPGEQLPRDREGSGAR